MTIAQTNERTPRKPLRLWPGVVAAVLLWLARFGHRLPRRGFGDVLLVRNGQEMVAVRLSLAGR